MRGGRLRKDEGEVSTSSLDGRASILVDSSVSARARPILCLFFYPRCCVFEIPVRVSAGCRAPLCAISNARLLLQGWTALRGTYFRRRLGLDDDLSLAGRWL